ncbi:MAG: M48 family metalloprotease [Rhodospirillaceae bacterium]|nr:M48 family metalloprotease [Rhodospirillaceae bacterium]
MAEPTEEAIAKEEELQRDFARRGMNVLSKAGERVSADPETRIYAIGNRILIGGADICGDRVRPTIPFGVRGLENGEYGVLWSVERAEGVDGPRYGDILTMFDDKPLEPGRRSGGALAGAMLDAAKAGREVNVGVRRGVQALNFRVAPVMSCDYYIEYNSRNEANAHADGERLVIYRGLLRLLGDDHEVAYVIGHELAHNALDHVAGGNRNAIIAGLLGAFLDAAAGPDPDTGRVESNATRLAMQTQNSMFSAPLEREADYVGMYIMAAAGYDHEAAPDAIRRISSLDFDQIEFQWGSTHPATGERAAAAVATAEEIGRKLAAGQPLIPEWKSAPQAKKSATKKKK